VALATAEEKEGARSLKCAAVHKERTVKELVVCLIHMPYFERKTGARALVPAITHAETACSRSPTL
jgi:hypothetical protein